MFQSIPIHRPESVSISPPPQSPFILQENPHLCSKKNLNLCSRKISVYAPENFHSPSSKLLAKFLEFGVVVGFWVVLFFGVFFFNTKHLDFSLTTLPSGHPWKSSSPEEFKAGTAPTLTILWECRRAVFLLVPLAQPTLSSGF